MRLLPVVCLLTPLILNGAGEVRKIGPDMVLSDQNGGNPESGLPARKFDLEVPDDKRESFYKLVLSFASKYSFVHMRDYQNLRLNDHFFGFDMFVRSSGVWFAVTDITRRGRMKIGFYGKFGKDDGSSNKEAAELAEKFETEISGYERYPD